MYTVHSYFLAVLAQSFTCVWIYPVLLSLVSFYCFQFEYQAPSDLFTYMVALCAIAIAGNFFGLSIGTMTDDQNVAILIDNLCTMLFNFGAGCFANTGDGANPVIKFLSWISPMHYGVQIVFKIISKG